MGADRSDGCSFGGKAIGYNIIVAQYHVCVGHTNNKASIFYL